MTILSPYNVLTNQMLKDLLSLKNVPVKMLIGSPESNIFSNSKEFFKPSIPYVYRLAAAKVMKQAKDFGSDMKIHEYVRIFGVRESGVVIP